jgi:hypothetical protein
MRPDAISCHITRFMSYAIKMFNIIGILKGHYSGNLVVKIKLIFISFKISDLVH